METLAAYNCKFVYVKGDDNTIADALSRYPFHHISDSTAAELSATQPFTTLSPTAQALLHTTSLTPRTIAAAIICIPPRIRPPAPISPPTSTLSSPPTSSSLHIDEALVNTLRNSYQADTWCTKLHSAAEGMSNLEIRDGLWYLDGRLIVPAKSGLRERIFRLAHDTLGHFGFFKSYEVIWKSYYWPGMRKDLEHGYIPSCPECQWYKSNTTKPVGPLHPLPVPDERCDDIAMDFIGPLPLDNGFNSLLTITDRLNSDYRLIPTTTDITAEILATLFFDNWYTENGLPSSIISDHDKLFVSRFWQHLCLLAGIDHNCSTTYHPQTDGASEPTNKTVDQMLRYHVARNQTGWVHALPRIRFQLMNTVNKSTGYTPFQLRFGKTPRILPPLSPPLPSTSKDAISAREVIEQIQADVATAKDNLALAKITQSIQANRRRAPVFPYKVGDWVLLNTINRRPEYKDGQEARTAKLMPRFDGPFQVAHIHPATSTITVTLPTNSHIFPTFHISLAKPFRQNNNERFPMQQ